MATSPQRERILPAPDVRLQEHIATVVKSLPEKATDRPPRLLFQQVSKWYGPVIGVNQVTLELRQGITGLVGANGAGKSTLMRLATGQLRPDIGDVQVCGHDALSAQAKRHFGYCPDVDTFYEDLTGYEFVLTMARLCGYRQRDAFERTAQVLHLVDMIDRAHRKLGGYSKGMRQRTKLAAALVHDPELLILDEPLSGIDPIGRRESLALFTRLAEMGKCLLVSSHELQELEKLTDHVAIMARGRIAAVGTLQQIRDLLDDHPLSYRIIGEQPRQLAGMLLAFPEVLGVDLDGADRLTVRTRQGQRFLRGFTRLVVEENLEIRHLEALDDSAHAVLGYLLGGRRR